MSKHTEKPSGLRPLQRKFYSLLGREQPKPVHPKLAIIYGYPLALIINQLLFWSGMESRKDGFIFKTEKDFIKEIGLSAAQQKLAIQKGKSYGFLEVKRMGLPGKRHYKLHFDKLVEVTIKIAESKNVVLTKSIYQLVDNHPTNTERTHENTTVNDNSVKSILSKNIYKGLQ